MIGRRIGSAFSADGALIPKPDLVSHVSWLSGFGVPVGVLPALSTRSTRLCLEPDLGVMLLLRNSPTGEATSSLLLLEADSDRCRGALDSGVVTETV
jgi:hypothetical protein